MLCVSFGDVKRSEKKTSNKRNNQQQKKVQKKHTRMKITVNFLYILLHGVEMERKCCFGKLFNGIDSHTDTAK